jgi:hypothetical protein
MLSPSSFDQFCHRAAIADHNAALCMIQGHADTIRSGSSEVGGAHVCNLGSLRFQIGNILLWKEAYSAQEQKRTVRTSVELQIIHSFGNQNCQIIEAWLYCRAGKDHMCPVHCKAEAFRGGLAGPGMHDQQ